MANYRDLIQAINQEASNIAALDARIRTAISTSQKLNELIDTVKAVYTDKDQQRVITQRIVRRVNAACPLQVVTYNRTTKAYEFVDKDVIKAAKEAAKAVKDAATNQEATPAPAQEISVVVATVGMVRASALDEALATIEGLIKALEVAEMAAVVTTAVTTKKAALKKAA